jgi:hypothetical protein
MNSRNTGDAIAAIPDKTYTTRLTIEIPATMRLI